MQPSIDSGCSVKAYGKRTRRFARYSGKQVEVDSRLTGIGLSATTPPPKKVSADCGRWNVREDRILLNPSYCIGPVQLNLSPARLQLDCSENVDEEAVEQWINKDSTL
ncbi:hypothetical protein AVEN_90693-1 [Araneus ventricosus]|uniref:Uncharacterized protein n=1 Tax=Araneus ventricosus TaxID=182803 RepID=A0A4Y2KSL8_ARAVE|nr:hypothetical protein AVEN_90693-1 [Araneus ventricosus]